MFEAPKRQQSMKWKDYSFDFRLFFVYHGCMMVLFVAGQSMTLRREIEITATLAVLLISLSLYNRRRRNWRWPDVRGKDVVTALGSFLLVGFFLFAATPLFPPNDPRMLPWYLAGLGIGTFGILSSLRLVYYSEAEFASYCVTVDQYGRELAPIPEIPEQTIFEANWKRVVRGIYTITFMLVWVAFVASFYFFGVSFRNGSPQPTASQTEPLTDHGKTVYVTRAEKQRIDRLMMAMWISIPSVLVGGFVLHFLVGVKLYSNATPKPGKVKKDPA